MYIEDLKSDFYEYLAGKRLILMVNYDVDSICTCKILQTLLKLKHVLYSVAIVQGISDLKSAYQENCSHVNHFVLINCGGTIDLVELFEPEEDVVFFVLDSHRPTDLCNIYSTGQIRLLGNPDENAQVPEFQDVFRDDDSDEDDDNASGGSDDDDGENRAAKRRRLGEEAILKRRERRLWEDRRDRLVFEYSQFTYYSKASAIVMYELAWKLSRDTKDILWLAIVALTEQLIMAKIEDAQYILEAGNLQTHVTRLQNRTNDTDVCTSLKITFEKDLRLALYRYWSVESSMKYSMYTACKMRLFSIRGDRRLQELLADMGLPLIQSRQTFFSMDLQMRQEFLPALEKLAEKYGLTELIFASFTLQYGYRNKFAASDIVYALIAILDYPPKDKNREECFHMALDCLSRTKKHLLMSSIEKAKIITTTLFKTVQNALETRLIKSAGPFLYFIVQEGCLDSYMLSHLHVLHLLAQFILRAYVSISRNQRAPGLPLVISAPASLEGSTCIILGIPPLREKSPKNFFGKAFEQAAERINCDTVCDYFDTAYFKLQTKDRTRFLDALTVLLG